jgi:hypothetical protein
MRAAWLGAALLAVGCSADHRFTLEYVEALAIGESARDDVLRRLGEPEEAPRDVFRSAEVRVTPPTPFAFLTWPLYWGSRIETFEVAARFDAQGVLREASLRVGGGTRSFFLIFIQPHRLAPVLSEERVRRLRALDAKGLKAAVGACFETLSLDEYERSFVPRSSD